MEAILVPILICLGFFAMVFGIVYMNKRENLAMIEKGMNPKTYSAAPHRSLKWGLLLVGAGLGLLLAFMIQHSGMFKVQDEDEYSAIYFALIAIGGGLGLILSYKIEKKDSDNKTEIYVKLADKDREKTL